MYIETLPSASDCDQPAERKENNSKSDSSNESENSFQSLELNESYENHIVIGSSSGKQKQEL